MDALALRLLLAKNCNPSDDEKKNLLFLFVKNGAANCVVFLLKKSTENVINGLNKEGHTLLHTAIELNQVECFHALLDDNRIDINKKSSSGHRLLHCVIKMVTIYNRTELMWFFESLLLDVRVNINEGSINGYTPFHVAVIWNNINIIDRLLAHKELNVNIRDERNRQQSKIRARVEHLFRILKCQFGYRKVRYRGLEKNRVQIMSLIAMANLYLKRNNYLANYFNQRFPNRRQKTLPIKERCLS